MRRMLLTLLLPVALAAAGLQPDLEYGKAGDVSLKMDAFVPEGSGPFAGVILVHGGGWQGGDKAGYVKPLFEPLTRAGFAWFSINYRLAPAYRYPAAVDDLEQAVRFVRAHAAEYKVDPARIAIAGESAGGHLVALVGARDGRELGIAAVVPFYAPTDMESLALGADRTPSAIKAVLGFVGVPADSPDAPGLLRESSPLTYVRRDMPPFLMIHGTGDHTVPFAQSVKMCDAMKRAGAECELFAVEGAPHGIGGWEKDPALQQYKARMVAWLQDKLGGSADQRRFAEIQARHNRGEQVTPEERAFAMRHIERQRAEFALHHPPRESTGLVPLPDLAAGSYQGEEGGLYPGGRNAPPPDHLKAGLARARQVVPRDAEGRPSPEGRIVLLSIGMSNTTMEFQTFQKLAAAEGGWNPRLALVDGAQGGQTAHITADPNANFWKVVDRRLFAAGVSAPQVQVVWLKQANAQPTRPFPAEAKTLEADIIATLHNLAARFPNLQIAYLSSRIYGGYAVTPLNPEPHAYETAFAVKWTIAKQIAGAPELRRLWIAWGPYLWTDGTKGRQDGLVWLREDVGDDGTHPSPTGRMKVARLLLDFLKSDPTSRPWFLAR